MREAPPCWGVWVLVLFLPQMWLWRSLFPECLHLPGPLCNQATQSLTPLLGEEKLIIKIGLFFLDLG